MKTAKIKKLNLNAKTPTQGSSYSAGFDLYAYIPTGSTYVRPHSTEKIHTGISIQPPEGYFGAIFARSGLATKEGLRPANCVGVCDFDYTGEYIVSIHNDTDKDRYIYNGDRIAQLVFVPFTEVNFIEVDELPKTDRSDSGFGSTGK